MNDEKIVLCIPGLWKDRSELVGAIARNSDGFILAGNYISKLKEDTDSFFEVELDGYNEQLAEAFEIAGNGTFSKKELSTLNKHSLTIYLIGEGGSFHQITKIVEVAYALLKAGGLGVKVESSGVANTIEKWSRVNNTKDMVELFECFVSVVEDTDFYYSCGMHCFGLPDVIAFKNQISPSYAQELIRIFCLYSLIENPNLIDGSTFSIDENSPSFILRQTPCRHFPEDDLFHNKYGIWAMVKKDS